MVNGIGPKKPEEPYVCCLRIRGRMFENNLTCLARVDFKIYIQFGSGTLIGERL